jgi:hypothetical protein
LGQVGKQVPQAPDREAEELAVVGHAQEDLGDRQGDQLGVGDPGWPARAGSLGEEVVQQDVNCRQKGVEVGAHGASLVNVAVATPDFGALRIGPLPAAARGAALVN